MADHTIPTPGTPLPWYVGDHPYAPAPRYIHIMPFKGLDIVAKAYASKPADAAYIVTACNLFPELVEALSELLEAQNAYRYKQSGRTFEWLKDAQAKAGAVLAKAGA